MATVTQAAPAHEHGPSHEIAGVKPPHIREFTPRAVITGVVVAAVIGASYPYIVMKLGFGPNISVVSAFFGFLALGLASKNYNRWENNIVQTAGTSAGQTAFLCVIMAAFDMLRMDPTANFHVTLLPVQSFLWLTTAGILGVLLSVPMRQHYVVDEKLTFADGVAAGETLIVLDSKGKESRAAARSLGIGGVLSGLLMIIRADARIIGPVWWRVPESLLFGVTGSAMNYGISWSLLNVGSGMLVGMRINTSMVIGALMWVIAPPLLLKAGVVPHLVRREMLLWIMWPGVGILVAGGLTALVTRWKSLVATFRGLSGASVGGGDFPMRWVIWGSLISAVALIVVQKVTLGISPWLTAVAIVLSLPLMLVGIRVLGETNWGPISALSNMMQGLFGLIAPGQILPNVASTGVTGSVATQSEGLMQDYKTGYMIGSTPKYLTYAQLIAVPVGALAVSYVYPLLRDTYGIGGDTGLQSPISQRFAGFATLLSHGLSALPHGAVQALAVGAVLGVVLTLLESTTYKKWVPSPTGIGIGVLIPGSAIITMWIGGAIGELWRMLSKANYERHVTPLASGFIVGEAIVAVLIPILVAVKLLHLQP
jgi:putative OPT family oligopeptide transporter